MLINYWIKSASYFKRSFFPPLTRVTIALELFAVHIMGSIDSKTMNQLKCNIDQVKRERIESFYFQEDAIRVLFADILIRVVTCHKLNLKNKDISFLTDYYGKPYLFNRYRYHFNLAHSGNWIICAVADCAVGIDIEAIKEIDFGLAKFFLNKTEYEYFINTAEKERKLLFYQLWVLKESYVKATGKGLYTPLNTFQVICDGKITNNLKEPDSLFLFKQYNIDNDYATALCAKNSVLELPKTIEILTIETLIEDFSALT